MDSLQVDSIISDANFYIITRDANQEISGFQAFSGQNRDNFQFVPNSGRAPEFGTFWHHCLLKHPPYHYTRVVRITGFVLLRFSGK